MTDVCGRLTVAVVLLLLLRCCESQLNDTSKSYPGPVTSGHGQGHGTPFRVILSQSSTDPLSSLAPSSHPLSSPLFTTYEESRLSVVPQSTTSKPPIETSRLVSTVAQRNATSASSFQAYSHTVSPNGTHTTVTANSTVLSHSTTVLSLSFITTELVPPTTPFTAIVSLTDSSTTVTHTSSESSHNPVAPNSTSTGVPPTSESDKEPNYKLLLYIVPPLFVVVILVAVVTLVLCVHRLRRTRRFRQRLLPLHEMGEDSESESESEEEEEEEVEEEEGREDKEATFTIHYSDRRKKDKPAPRPILAFHDPS